ncbi:hypothetical protein O3G_MSEX014472 [Manduca sexta]|uniref:Uncharacterized protein n=1 Tax=Manduca sexta TaxID=7130 RepID=A0A921ZVC0_MANSE|nr:hypothetical protein O3G_MSEX014472 [Manduca sexta]
MPIQITYIHTYFAFCQFMRDFIKPDTCIKRYVSLRLGNNLRVTDPINFLSLIRRQIVPKCYRHNNPEDDLTWARPRAKPTLEYTNMSKISRENVSSPRHTSEVEAVSRHRRSSGKYLSISQIKRYCDDRVEVATRGE